MTNRFVKREMNQDTAFMAKVFDVGIVGLGAMGSAAMHYLSQEGLSVIGFDRFHPPHNLGSSHGHSRVIREAYFEDPLYVPLVKRAYELWSELEEQSGKELFLQTGGLMMGKPDSIIVSGAKESADVHGLPYQLISANEIRERYPMYEITDETIAVWEPRAGILYPEKCIELFLGKAAEQGAETHTSEAVVAWRKIDSAIEITTKESKYSVGKLILSVGPWMSKLIPDLNISLQTDRQLLFWFEAAQNQADFKPENFPIFIWEYEDEKFFYGFPDLGTGIKVAPHYQGTQCDPESIERDVSEDEIEAIRSVLSRFLPDANGKLLSSAVCMYTNTEDLHFIIDQHPENDKVWIVSPCSGHGFKFAPAIGEILTNWITTGRSPFKHKLFRLDRFN